MDYHQLSRYFSGEMSQEEKENFLSGLAGNHEEWDEAANLKNLWASAQMDTTVSDRRIAGKGWDRFRNNRRKDRNIFRWRHVAASVLIICSVGIAAFIAGKYSWKEPAIACHTLSVPAGQYAQLTLSDGSEIWLNSRSMLVYPERFTTDTREVHLEGEGFFNIASDKEHPFIVKTNVMDIIATGTRFNVSAYEDDSWISATLIEGVVDLHSFRNGINYTIKEGQTVEYDKPSNHLVVKQADADMQISWIHGEFRFKNMALADITRRLERNFNVTFIYEDESMKERIFTGTFYNHQSIETILRIIAKSTRQLQYEIKNNIIYIK